MAFPAAAIKPQRAEALARFGVERWAVKTLSDPLASQVSFAPRGVPPETL